MRRQAHTHLTKLAFELLEDEEELWFADRSGEVLETAWSADQVEDLELVWVRGFHPSFGRDDPHREAAGDVGKQDRAFYKVDPDLGIVDIMPAIYCTAFNHYIDIAKGDGIFDDYDGYSYKRGSGRMGQHEGRGWTFGLGYDGIISEALKWCYVHVRGRRWYREPGADGRECSPSAWQYSFFGDRGDFSSAEAEGLERFPHTRGSIWPKRGVKFSVFLPVDNMARYRYHRFVSGGPLEDLGYVLHAIQDASVPHHAAGRAGNWHRDYEEKLDERAQRWFDRGVLKEEVLELYDAYKSSTNPSPGSLGMEDRGTVPGIGWRVDMLVTWMALQAFEVYRTTYDGFAGFDWARKFDSDESRATTRELTVMATALSMVALVKAHRERPGP